MMSASVRFRTWVGMCCLALLGSAGAQRAPSPKPSVSSSPRPRPRAPSFSNPDTSFQPTFISGKVVLEGIGAPGEPVGVERVCGGATRLLGYTDPKGEFQIALASNPFQDASENDPRSGRSLTPQGGAAPPGTGPFGMTGCELRAVLAGFQSSRVLMMGENGSWQFEAGTIVLQPLEGVQGTTISLASLSAPADARRAYEKAERAVSRNKLDQAEAEAQKAVQISPQFAAAWTLLGDLHGRKGQWDQARMEYGRAVAADPKFLNPCFKLAFLAIQQKQWEEAVQWTDQLFRMNSSAFPSAYLYSAVANFNLHRFEVAEENARKFKALDTAHTQPGVSLLLGVLLERKQDYAGAAQQIREYLAAVPSAPNAQQLREKAQRLEGLNVARQVHDPQ